MVFRVVFHITDTLSLYCFCHNEKGPDPGFPGIFKCIHNFIHIVPVYGHYLPSERSYLFCHISQGHASPAVYAALALRGYFPVELLDGFRKINSKLEGHVHRGIPGVESSTGSLGQGLGVAIGFALESKLDAKTNRIYAILGDGEMEEGNIWESLLAASKYHLGNLTAILDRNGIQLDGFTEDIMPLGNVAEKVAPFGWEVMTIDGNNMNEVVDALEYSRKPRDRPLFIVAKTVKGKGVSYMENNPKYHGRIAVCNILFYHNTSKGKS